MQIGLGIKKYSLLLGVLFGGQQMQGMEMALQVTSTIVDCALTIAQSAPFLVGVMPGVFNDYVMLNPLLTNTLGEVSGLNNLIYRMNTDGIVEGSILSFKFKANVGKKFNLSALKAKFNESKIATLFCLVRNVGSLYGLVQIIRKDDDKMMGKKGIRMAAALLIEMKLLGELFG